MQKQLLIASMAMLCCGGMIGAEDEMASSLFLKPVFELSKKDQILLDILQEPVLGTPTAFQDLKEEHGVYPEPFEKTFTYYLTQVVSEGSEHEFAVSKAAHYLQNLLQKCATAQIITPDTSNVRSHLREGDCVALLIGINYENTASELTNCVLDIDHVLSTLLTPHIGVRHENVIYMSEHSAPSLYPTKANILKQFAHFTSLVNQTKVGYFHYSGHGSSVKDTSKDELDGKDEALVPVDYESNGFLIDDDIFAELVQKLDADVNLLVTTDCCHSGTILDLPYKWKADGSHTIEHRLGAATLQSLPRVVMLSGCKDNQTSADGGPITVSGQGSGALTGAFLHVLKAHNYRITYRQLLVEVNDYLARNGFDQRPELTSSYLLNLDDYYMNEQSAKALSEV